MEYGVRSGPEFRYRSASVFIQVFDIIDDLQFEGSRKSKRTNSNRQERSERDRRRRGERAPTDDEDVSAGSYGTGKSHVVSAVGLSTMRGVADCNVFLFNNGFGLSRQEPSLSVSEIVLTGQELNNEETCPQGIIPPTPPLATGAVILSSPRTDWTQDDCASCEYPALEGTNDYVADLEMPSDYRITNVDKGWETSLQPCVSPTIQWTQDASANEVAELCLDTLEELLKGLLFSPLPIFGKVGILKKAFPLFVQTLHGSGDTRPYIVHPGSPDVCY